MKIALSIVSVGYIIHGLGMLALSGFFGYVYYSHIASEPDWTWSSDEALGMMMLTIMSLIITCASFLISFLLLARKNYLLALIVAGSLLIAFPLATLLSVVCLLLLRVDAIKVEFDSRTEEAN